MSERQQYVEEALAAYQVAGQFRLLSMRTGLEEFAELSTLYIERAWRYERYANELPVSEVKPVVEEKKEMHPISRLITLFVILLLVLSMGSAGAQDVPLETNTPDVIEGTATLVESTAIAPTAEVTPVPEPEQPPVEETPTIDLSEFMPYLTQIIIAFLIGIVLLGGTAIVVAGQGMPKWARMVIKGSVDSGFEQAQKEVAKTPQTWDDELLMDLKRKVDALFERMDTPPSPPVPLNPEAAAYILQQGIPNTPGNQG